VSDEAPEQVTEASIPRPAGYKILVRFIKASETFENSSIVKPDISRRAEEFQTQVGQVIDMGPDCYSDKDRFPSGPWCKVGDYVMFDYISGRRFKLGRHEFRMLNDDQVEGTIEDPAAAVYYLRGI